MTRLEAQRRYQVKKDINLKLLREKQVKKIKKQRESFRIKVNKQKQRAEEKVRSKGDKRLQDKFTDKQLKRRQKQIKRNIAKKNKLKYARNGGDIAFGNSIDREEQKDKQKWVINFYSSNVWKFKIRGKNLLVGFLDGSVYIYYGAAKLFAGMNRAGSKGKYVWRHLRRKGVTYLKIK